MIKMGHKVGQGLDLRSKGIINPLHMHTKDKCDRFGLGYKPTWEDRRQETMRKRDAPMAKLEN